MISICSYRFRLAAVIFTLVAALLGLLLWTLLRVVRSGYEQRILAREDIYTEFIADNCRRALLVKEYDEVQAFLREIVRNPNIKKVILADRRGRIVASTSPADIGGSLTQDLMTGPYWRHFNIVNPAGILGMAGVNFSRTEIESMAADLRRQASLLALPVLFATAGVAWLLGALLARRLETLTHAVQEVADGRLDTRASEGGNDEVGRLARAFNAMTGTLQQLVNDLSASEARLKEAQEAALIGSWELNHVTGDLWWSEEVHRLFELPSEGFGASYEAFLAKLPPDDRARVDAAFSAAVRDRTPYDIVHRLCMDDGRMKHLQEVGRTLYDPSGVPLRSIGTVQDITERVLAEKDLRIKEAAMESALSGIAMADMERKITYVNAAWLAMHGYGAAVEVLGSCPMRFVQDPAVAEAAMHATVNRGAWQGEVMCLRRDGSAFPAELFCNLVTGTTGEPLQLLASFRDITARKQAEAEKARLEDELRQAQKMEAIGTLAGGIAHDFNNILAVILGYAELVELTLSPGTPVANNIAQVIKAGARAKELVAQILAFSRKDQQAIHPVRLQPLVKEAVKFLRASLPASIAMELDVAADCPAIMTTPTQAHQVLINLCTNAAQAMEEKGGRLEIRLGRVTFDPGQPAPLEGLSPGVYARLQVSDTGHGMDEATARRVFEPYFTTKDQGKGTGLGLAVVHGIVKGCGGGIGVESEVDRGTTFTVYFPATELMSVEEQGVSGSFPQGSERVLAVDDEPAVVDFIKSALETLGYHVTATRGSREALELFRASPEAFDLVITDQTMPEMLGTELAREVTALKPGIPVILCTGYSSKVTQETAGSFLVKSLAMKPLNVRTLASLVRKALDG